MSDIEQVEAKYRCLCGNLIDAVKNLRKYYSGVVNCYTVICDDCLKEVKDASHLVCLKCKKIVGHMPTGKEKAGFEFKRNTFYHIAKCPYCSDVTVTPIIEQVMFYQENNIPYVTDEDIVEEIDKKTLQGEKELVELRKKLSAKHLS